MSSKHFRSAPSSEHSDRSACRQGLGILEMLIALILLGSMATYIIPTIGKIEQLQKKHGDRAALQQTVLNIIETLHAWAETDPAFQEQNSEQLVERLRSEFAAEPIVIELVLRELPADSAGGRRQQIEVTVQQQPAKTGVKPVSCTTWLALTTGEEQ